MTGDRDRGTVSLWDVERGLIMSLTGLEGTIQQVAVSPDGRRIAAVDSAGVHRVWDSARARELYERIVAECNWAAFGRIAAEAELARS